LSASSTSISIAFKIIRHLEYKIPKAHSMVFLALDKCSKLHLLSVNELRSISSRKEAKGRPHLLTFTYRAVTLLWGRKSGSGKLILYPLMKMNKSGQKRASITLFPETPPVNSNELIVCIH
jgi:hypothetical protein